MARLVMFLISASFMVSGVGCIDDGVDQAASSTCLSYLSCVGQLQGGDASVSLEPMYGESAVCWETTHAAADECLESCVMALSSLSITYRSAVGVNGKTFGSTSSCN